MQRAVRRSVSALQLATEQRLNALTDALHTLEMRAELRMPAAALPVPSTSAALAKIEEMVAAKTAILPEQKQEELMPEILVVLAAAVTAFLGKKVRVRSAKMLQSPYEIVNP